MNRPKWMKKEWLAMRLVEYPLLRLLLFTFWFRVAFLGLIGLGVGFALLFPKMWRVTPLDFVPVVKVSWLDLIQARSLRHSAQQAEQAGNLDEAYHAWLSALANNPGDPRATRGLLRILLQKKGKAAPGEVRQAVSRCYWLLEMSAHAPSDLELVAELFEKYQLHELNILLIRQKGDLQNPSLLAHYLKGLFHTRRMAHFAEIWTKTSPEWLARQPELALYHAAWNAGWGPRENRAEAWQQLLEAQSHPSTRLLSLELQLAASFQQSRAEDYSQALQMLAEMGADSVNHHVDYWRLLDQLGKKGESIRLANAYPKPPGSPSELASLAEINRVLGLKDQAKRLLATYAPEFSYTEQVWWAYGSFLLAEKQYEDLLPLALQIRQEPQARDSLKAYSHYLEGTALHEQGRAAEAGEAYQRCADYGLANEAIAMTASAEMVRRKFPKQAMQLLEAIEKSCISNSYYWSIVSSAAISLKHIERLTRAVTQAYHLNPSDWQARNNYAATLLAARTNAQIAISLTYPLMMENPASNTARINHALALLLNQRAPEAHSLLQSIDARTLNPSETTSFHFAWLQYYLGVSNQEAAQKVFPKIDRRYLMPEEERWLDQAAADLKAKRTG